MFKHLKILFFPYIAPKLCMKLRTNNEFPYTALTSILCDSINFIFTLCITTILHGQPTLHINSIEHG